MTRTERRWEAAPSATEPGFIGPIEITDARGLDEICRFRVAVWRETGDSAEGAFADKRWRDEFDDGSRHWVIRQDGELVAAARISIHERLEDVPEADEYLAAGIRLEGRIAAPARVVVASAAQRHGLASRLLDVQDSSAEEAGVRFGVRQASPGMRRLLVQRGWREFGVAAPDPRFPGVTFHVMARAYGRSDFPGSPGPLRG